MGRYTEEDIILAFKRNNNSIERALSDLKAQETHINLLETDKVFDYVRNEIINMGIPVNFIESKSRKRETHVYPRFVCMYILKKVTAATLDDIGFYSGKKDHATVNHGVKTVDNLLRTDYSFKHNWEHFINNTINKLKN